MRYYFISFVIHMAIFSFIWVGIAVPQPQEDSTFTYLGDISMAMEDSEKTDTAYKVTGGEPLKFKADFFSFISTMVKNA